MNSEYETVLVSAGFWRELYVNLPAGIGHAEIACVNNYILSCDFDLSEHISLLGSVRQAGFSTQDADREIRHFKARYRFPKNRNLQLQLGHFQLTNPNEDIKTIGFNLRDYYGPRLQYWADYKVLFKSLGDTTVETHMVGLFFDLELTAKLSWFFDLEYSLDIRNDKDISRFYHTGVRIPFN